jgi:hypothetical protein
VFASTSKTRGGGADAQAFGQAGQDAHDPFHGCLFTVEERAMGL